MYLYVNLYVYHSLLLRVFVYISLASVNYVSIFLHDYVSQYTVSAHHCVFLSHSFSSIQVKYTRIGPLLMS